MSSPISPPPRDSATDHLGLRFNFFAGVTDGIGWPLGMAFFSTSTILEAFLLRLHASYLLIGAMPALISLGYFMPGLFVARTVKKLPLVRPWLFWIGIGERIPILLIPLIVVHVGVSNPSLLLNCFFILFGIHAVMLGCNQPSYWVIIGKLIPTKVRGRMFGIAGLIGGLAGFGVDPITHFFLDRAGSSSLDGYAWCFLIGGLILLVSFLPFALLREKPTIPEADSVDPHAGHYLRDAIAVLRGDPGFRLMLLSSIPFAFCAAAPTYYLAASTVRFHPGPAEVALYTTVVVVASAFGNILWGLWADRRGNKIVMLTATLLGAIGTAVSLTVQSQFGYALVFAFSALGMAGVNLTSYNIVLEFAPDETDIPLYMAVYNGVSGPFKALAPIAYGWMAERAGFNPVFVSGAVLGMVSLLMFAPVREPRKRARTALETM